MSALLERTSAELQAVEQELVEKEEDEDKEAEEPQSAEEDWYTEFFVHL